MKEKKICAARVLRACGVENASLFLEDIPCQALLSDDAACVRICKGGYVLLDFGRELHGGIAYAVQALSDPDTRLRIVFGESAMEALSTIGQKNATNDHAVRDMTIALMPYSTQQIGGTGFRFVKLEAVGGRIDFRTVQAVLRWRDLPYQGAFESSDPLLNQIWQTAAYTVHLNMQEYLWDGIKRDRLVWVGDMHPETSSIAAVFGTVEPVWSSLDLIRDATAPDQWMNGIASYTLWWMKIQRDWYWQSGNREYLAGQIPYLCSCVEHVLRCVDSDGTIRVDSYFVDWSSNEQPQMQAGFCAVTILGLEAAAELLDLFGRQTLAARCRKAVAAIRRRSLPYAGNKQVAALISLAGMERESVIREILLKDGAQGISCFLGYYTLEAARGDMPATLEIIRQYWGAMLAFGATTFWEDFDLAWTKNAARIDEIVPPGKSDLHGDFGRFCYKQYRHSLCHGWASGPAAFLSRRVLGITPAAPGFSRVHIKPDLGGLEFVHGAYPTPFGPIEVTYEYHHGDIQKEIKLPSGVTLA